MNEGLRLDKEAQIRILWIMEQLNSEVLQPGTSLAQEFAQRTLRYEFFPPSDEDKHRARIKNHGEIQSLSRLALSRERLEAQRMIQQEVRFALTQLRNVHQKKGVFLPYDTVRLLLECS